MLRLHLHPEFYSRPVSSFPPLSSSVHRNQPPNAVLLPHGHRRALLRDRPLPGREPKRAAAAGGEVRPRAHRGRLGEDPDPGRLRGATRPPGLGSLPCVPAPAGVPLTLVLCSGVSSMALQFEILLFLCHFANNENTKGITLPDVLPSWGVCCQCWPALPCVCSSHGRKGDSRSPRGETHSENHRNREISKVV